MSGLANTDRLLIVIVLACYTARFHTELDLYECLLGGDWTGGAGARPQPTAIMPPKHDRDSMAEDFLVKHEAGAVACISSVSKYEQGGKPLGL